MSPFVNNCHQPAPPIRASAVGIDLGKGWRKVGERLDQPQFLEDWGPPVTWPSSVEQALERLWHQLSQAAKNPICLSFITLFGRTIQHHGVATQDEGQAVVADTSR